MSNQQQKTVLAFDTAMGGVSVGINAAGGHTVSRMVETTRGQASMLIPIIQEVLEEAESEFKDLDLIISSIGPGSFTGLRIGLATARVLALALNIPVVGLNTLDMMAEHYEADKPLLIVLETKRQDFYARYYDADGNPLTEAFAADASVVLERAPSAPFVVGGDCLSRFLDNAPCAQARGRASVSGDFECLDNLTQPDPILMTQIGLERFEAAGEEGTPQPLYLRGADVSEPKVPPRKLASV